MGHTDRESYETPTLTYEGAYDIQTMSAGPITILIDIPGLNEDE